MMFDKTEKQYLLKLLKSQLADVSDSLIQGPEDVKKFEEWELCCSLYQKIWKENQK